MRVCDINPHIRLASQVRACFSGDKTVYARDCRLFYILDGVGKICTGSSEISLNKDGLFYCRGGTSYRIQSDGPMTLYVLNFDLTQRHNEQVLRIPLKTPEETPCLAPIDDCHIQDSDFLNSFRLFEDSFFFKKHIHRIAEEFSFRKLYFRENAGAILKGILTQLHNPSTDMPDTVAKVIYAVTEYIHANYKTSIHNSDLAKIAGYHEYHLNRVFCKYMGTSMHQYIINLRITEAQRLLLNTELSISDIAIQTGFHSNAHFTALFKREFHVSPFEYRNHLKGTI